MLLTSPHTSQDLTDPGSPAILFPPGPLRLKINIHLKNRVLKNRSLQVPGQLCPTQPTTLLPPSQPIKKFWSRPQGGTKSCAHSACHQKGRGQSDTGTRGRDRMQSRVRESTKPHTPVYFICLPFFWPLPIFPLFASRISWAPHSIN